MAKYTTAALQAATSTGIRPRSNAKFTGDPGEDQPLTKMQAQAGAKATGGMASQDFKNNGEWVYGPKGGANGSANVNRNVRNWMTNGNASKGPRI